MTALEPCRLEKLGHEEGLPVRPGRGANKQKDNEKRVPVQKWAHSLGREMGDLKTQTRPERTLASLSRSREYGV